MSVVARRFACRRVHHECYENDNRDRSPNPPGEIIPKVNASQARASEHKQECRDHEPDRDGRESLHGVPPGLQQLVVAFCASVPQGIQDRDGNGHESQRSTD